MWGMAPHSSESSQQRAESVPAKCTLALVMKNSNCMRSLEPQLAALPKQSLYFSHRPLKTLSDERDILKIYQHCWTLSAQSENSKQSKRRICDFHCFFFNPLNRICSRFKRDVTRQKNSVIESFQFSKFHQWGTSR